MTCRPGFIWVRFMGPLPSVSMLLQKHVGLSTDIKKKKMAVIDDLSAALHLK
ncbi:hypothetical protein QS257_16300 [Terrilactibacillus sp. S3-3]|nr:hypothetical protein QS257_16300 [Terrilactibacillus sp. S3-3]